MFPNNCPILEQTADGYNVGRCWFHLENNKCPRHGDVTEEIIKYRDTGKCTLENDMRKRKGLPELGTYHTYSFRGDIS